MTWFQDAANQSAAVAAHAEVIRFVDLDLTSGHLRLHTRTGTIVWGSSSPIDQWIGVGKLGTIETVREDVQLRPNTISLTLSGVDAAIVTSFMTEDFHGRAISVYDGFLDPATFALVADPELTFQGMMDSSSIALDRNTGTITITCESELARWSIPRLLSFTPESQSLLYTGDKFFDYVKHMVDRELDWSKKYAPGYLANRFVKGTT